MVRSNGQDLTFPLRGKGNREAVDEVYGRYKSLAGFSIYPSGSIWLRLDMSCGTRGNLYHIDKQNYFTSGMVNCLQCDVCGTVKTVPYVQTIKFIAIS